MAISEYDAFGPWIYEIDSEHPAPALFQPYLKQQTYLKRLKIPRNIERRKATPDMELYDFVLEAGEKNIRILKREGVQVSERVIPYSELEYVRLSRIILNGNCTFSAGGKQTEVLFNAISFQLMQEFLRLIRDRYAAKERRALPAQPMTQPLPDVLFVNLARDLQETGEHFSVMAFQPERQLVRLKKTLVPHRRIKSPAVMHMTDGRELLLVERQSPAFKAKQRELGYSYTFMPLEKLKNAEIKESAVYSNIEECHLKGEQGDFYFLAHQQEESVLNYYRLFASPNR